jgi:hypothetical protein
MRRLILGLAATMALLASSPAQAARPCQDRSGDPIRCGTPGAMPVGWTLQGQKLIDLHVPERAEPGLGVLFGAGCLIGGLFALILRMPPFEDWDEQEKDDAEPG